MIVMDTTNLQPSEAERAQRRCLSLLQDLITNSLPASKLSGTAKLTLLRLLRSELRFLRQLPSHSIPISSNIGHFESIVRVLLHPALRNASRICKPVPSCSAQVDIVCTFASSPVWFLVSDRNPNAIGTLRARAERALLAARSAPVALRPSALFLVFSRGIRDETASAICCHLGAVEVEEGVGSRWFKIEIEGDDDVVEFVKGVGVFGSVGGGEEVDFGKDAFGGLVKCLRNCDLGVVDFDLMNFDTTALVAMVSGISNGGAERLVRAPEGEMIRRFKGNYRFVIAQATSELEQPILIQLKVVLEGKKGIICESVLSEFKELISMCGGANEKLRADQLLKHLLSDGLACWKGVLRIPKAFYLTKRV